MRIRPVPILFLSLLSIAGISASAWALTYVVKHGDTLSKIAAKQFGKPVYGKSGSLKKILAVNSQIKNQNLIFIGQKIEIDGASIALEDANADRGIASVNETQGIPADKKLEAFVGYGIFSLTPEFVSTKILATDPGTQTTATLVSKSNIGVSANYTQVWTESLQTDFFFSLNKLSMNEPSSGGTIQNTDQTLYSFGAIAKFNLSSKVTLGAGLGLFERVYLVGVSSSIVSLDPLYVPSVRVSGAYDFFSKAPFTMGASAGFNLDLPASASGYRSKVNPSYSAAFYVKQRVSASFQTEVGLRACYTTENTSIVQQSQTDYGIYLKLNFPFGEGKK